MVVLIYLSHITKMAVVSWRWKIFISGRKIKRLLRPTSQAAIITAHRTFKIVNIVTVESTWETLNH